VQGVRSRRRSLSGPGLVPLLDPAPDQHDRRRRAARLSRIFASLGSLSTDARQASRAARSLLDGVATAGACAPAHELPWRFLHLAAHLRWPTPRFAAHLVTICIVLLVALGARRAPPVLIVPAGSAAPAAGRADADVRLQRQIAAPAPGVAGDLALPAVRAPQEQFAPTFSESHTVAEGETLGQIAAEYRVSVATLFWANGLDEGYVLAVGQDLRIPRVSGIPHVIAEGETLESIAALFQVRPEAIVLFQSNGLRADQPLPVGREIFIPGGSLAFPDDLLSRYGGEQGIAALRAVAAGTVRDSDTNLRAGPGRDYPHVGSLDAGRLLKLLARHAQWVKVEAGADKVGWVRGDLVGLSEATLADLAETNDFPPPPRWVWPTRGTITSPFGWRTDPYRSFHNGLDMANATWTKIYAARGGRVIESGWCSGFGYCVEMDHGDGITTIYGHMVRRPPVKVGDSVDAGDLIGYMGSTFDASGGGYSTGPHLHFTVKVNGKAVNPLKFLP